MTMSLDILDEALCRSGRLYYRRRDSVNGGSRLIEQLSTAFQYVNGVPDHEVD